MGLEKRRAPRFDIEWSLTARLSSGQLTHGHTVNISTSGVLFSIPVDLNELESVDLEIQTARLERIICRVRIMRQVESGSMRRMYGAEFERMSKDDCLVLGHRLVAIATAHEFVSA